MKKIVIDNNLYDLGRKTLIMGILNVTPDSFSDGGKFFSFNAAVKKAIQMEKDGADIIDIGGESTRPGAVTITLSEEMTRIMPIIEELSEKIKIPISVDTYKSEIAEKALKLGASMINDVTALRVDKNLVKVIADKKVPICLMHMKGRPSNMQINPSYEDVVSEIIDFFKERIGYAISNGVRKENIIIDPGLGFGKRTGSVIEDNVEILKRLNEFKKLDYPIMIGASRKNFIGNVCGDNNPLPVNNRLEGSIAAACIAAINGANIVRVHDVKETRKALNLIDCIIR